MRTPWILMLAAVLALVCVGVGNRLTAVGADDETDSEPELTEKAEGMTDNRSDLVELHDLNQEHIEDTEDELGTLDAEGPAETPALKAFVEARREHLQKRSKLDRAILAIKGVARLERARELAAQVDESETEWDLVLDPTLRTAMDVEEMETHLKQDGNQKQREIVKKLKVLQQEDAAARKKEYDLFKARQSRTAAMEALLDDFWGEN